MANKLWIPVPFHSIDTSLKCLRNPCLQVCYVMIRKSFPRPDLIGSHIGEQGTQLFPISVSGDMKRLLLREEALSHCLWSLDSPTVLQAMTSLNILAGNFLLDEKLYSSQS